MLNKTRAIVLHHVKYGESSLVLTLYTAEMGRIACMVNGVRSRKSRFPITLFQPLTLLDVDLYYRQNREIQRVKEVSCPVHYHTIPFNISKNTIALFLAEVLYLALREEESNPPLFSFMYHAFQLLDTRDEGYSLFHVWFMLHLTRHLGFFPPDSEFQHGIVSPFELPVFGTLSPGASSALTKIAANAQGPPEQLHLSNQDRSMLLESLIRYYTVHLDGFSRLKSYAVLQEVFKDG
jgi:DNA repair protein RecO (recombination protein O)